MNYGPSWKTTAMGILMIVGALCTAGVTALQGHAVDFSTTATAIGGGLGLLAAKDHDKA